MWRMKAIDTEDARSGQRCVAQSGAACGAQPDDDHVNKRMLSWLQASLRFEVVGAVAGHGEVGGFVVFEADVEAAAGEG